MAPATTRSDPHQAKYDHVIQVWLKSSPFVTQALAIEKVSTYLELQVLLRDLNKVNALKNKKGEAISPVTSARLRAAMSLINEQQIKLGDITQVGAADITLIDDIVFDNYVLGGSKYTEYSLEAVEKHKTAVADLQLAAELRKLAVEKAKQEILAVQNAAQSAAVSATTSSATVPTALGAGTGGSQQAGTPSNVVATQSSQGVANQNLSQNLSQNPPNLPNLSANSGTTPQNVTSNTASSSSAGPNHELTRMQRAHKPDPTNVALIGNSYEYAVWRLRLNNYAQLHGYGDVLNSNYTPITPNEVAIFRHAQYAIYEVLEQRLEFEEGKQIVRQYLSSADAQKIIEILDSKYLDSGSLSQKDTLKGLRNFLSKPMTKACREKGLYPAIEKWKTYHGRYNELKGSTLDEDTALTWLETYLSNVPQLDNVSDLSTAIEEVLMTRSARQGINLPHVDIDLEETLGLYSHAAKKYDIKRKETVTAKRNTMVGEIIGISNIRQTYALDVDRELGDLLDYGLDNNQWYRVYVAKPKHSVGRIPSELWNTLTREEKIMWQELNPETRELILGCRASKPLALTAPTTPTAPTPRSIPRRRGSALKSSPQQGPVNQRARVNLTDATANDDTHDVPVDGTVDEEEENARVHANVTNVRNFIARSADTHAWQDQDLIDSARDMQLVEANQTSHRHPFDMTRFLSQSDDGSGGLQTSRAVNIHEDVDGGDVTFYDARSAMVVETFYDNSDAPPADTRTLTDEDDDKPGVYYTVLNALARTILGLIDRGANGGVFGDRASGRVINYVPGKFIDVVGIDNHTISRRPIGSVGMVARVLYNGKAHEVILIFHQYAILDRGQTIHSSIQMEAFGNVVDDKAIAYGGTQTICTPQGMVIPLDVKNGLVRIQTRAYTDDEWESLPHVVMTSDAPWVPTPADNNISDDDDWYARQPPNPLSHEENFDMHGEYLHRTAALLDTLPSLPTSAVVGRQFQNSFVIDAGLRTPDGDDIIYLPPRLAASSVSSSYSSAIALDIGNFRVSYTAVGSTHSALAHPLRHMTDLYGGQMMDHSIHVHERRDIPRDLEAHRRFFLGAPASVVRHTFEATEQNYRTSVPDSFGLRNTYRSHYPAINVFRRREMVSTDTIYFDLEVQGGFTCCQVYMGRSSFYLSVHGMRDSDGEFINTFEDEIRLRGAMDRVGRDGAESMHSNRLLTLLRTLHIDDWTSEAYLHHQNIIERYIQEVKKLTKRVQKWSGCPPEMALHAIEYVVFIWNRTARQKLGWRTPYEALTGQTPDVSIILFYRFWQRIYIKNYRRMGTGFPSGTDEILAHFIGFGERIGHSMTFKVWVPVTKKVLYRSITRPATDDDVNHPGNPPDDDNVDYDDMDILHNDVDDEEGFAAGNIGIDDEIPGSHRRKEEVDGQSGTVEPLQPDNVGISRSAPASNNAVADEGLSGTVDMDERRSRTIDAPAGRTRSRSREQRSGEIPSTQSQPQASPPIRTQSQPQATAPGLRGNDDALENCIGRTVLLPRQEDGQRFRAKIVELIEDHESNVERDPERIKFRCKVGDEEFEKLVDYNEMCEFIEEQVQNEDGTWRFRRITGHSTPKSKSEKPRLLMEWESGEITLEPVYTIAKSDPWVVAEYARDHDLVDEWHSMWPSLKLPRYAKNGKKLMRMINQAKRHSYKNSPIWQYGHQVPRNHREAMELDRLNGNNKWAESEKLEKDQLLEYQTFNDLGHKSTCNPPPGYKKINLHLVYAVKFDGRYKSRIVAGGHLTDTPLESVYSGVVSLRGVRFVLFLAELNGLEVYQSDVGNAYLESYTKEKVYVIGGPELHDLEGHILVIVKALYGLKSSGLRWHERFSEVLRDMGFYPCPAEPDIWMRACNSDGTVIDDPDSMGKMGSKATMDQPPTHLKDGSYYEYIAVYCDDLTIASKHPLDITNALTGIYKFKLKGTGPLNFLLGCNYFREGKVLCAAPKKYIDKMKSTYERMFGEKPSKKVTSPLEHGDNPELDTSDFLEERSTKIYQSMIGAAQWVIQLGRIDIAVHVMTLSSFRAQPRKGHLDRIKRIYGYLCKMDGAVIRFRTEMPDISDFTFPEFDWSNTPHADAKEEYPSNLPVARGEPVLMVTYVDANLMHDKLSGKSVTGVLHFLNKTPIDWFTKKQGTVETATFGSENNAARTAVEQIKANKLLLLYLGAPIADTPILLGDNEAVVNNNTTPHGKLHKRHHILSYTFVRDNIAAGVLKFAHIPGEFNPADILSKHWSYSTVWPLLQPLLFWKGDTMNIERKS